MPAPSAPVRRVPAACPVLLRIPSASTFVALLLFLSALLPPSVSAQERVTCADDPSSTKQCKLVRKKKWFKYCPKVIKGKNPGKATYADICPFTCKTCIRGVDEGIYVTDFGAVGDSHFDDTAALQAAVDFAYNNNGTKHGGIVHLGRGVYRTSEPLIIPDGVRVVGEGYGGSPLAIDFGGSVLAYCGTDRAVIIRGHNAGLERLAVYDYPYGKNCGEANGVRAAGGVLVDAHGRVIESVVVRDVLIYFFTGGTALELRARKGPTSGGGIVHGSYYDVRIRHTKVGIRLSGDQHPESFVRSNHFRGGAISGTVEEAAVIAEGPGACNDNLFEGMSIEPGKTKRGHVIVTGPKTQVRLVNVRLEGSNQDPTLPMVDIGGGSHGNVLDGVIGHTFVRADFNMNPRVVTLTHKGTSVAPHASDAFHNTAFHGFVPPEGPGDAAVLPGWMLPQPDAGSFALSPATAGLYPDYRVLNVTLAPSTTQLEISPSSLQIPAAHGMCSFGVYVRSGSPGAVSATMRSRGGGMVSSHYSGAGEWQFVGSSGLFDRSTGPQPTFDVYSNAEITAPSFLFGSVPPTPGAELLSASGAKMTGTLSMGMVTVSLPPTGSTYWELPKEGNLFLMGTLSGESSTLITRINHSSDRFPAGTVITVLLPEVGVTFKNGGYLILKGGANFSPKLANSSLTLVSTGTGSWREASRND